MHKNKYVYIIYLILPFFFFSCSQLGFKASSQEGKKLAASRGKDIKSGPGANAPNGFLNKKKLIEDIVDRNLTKVQIKLNIIKDLINKGLNNKSLEVPLASLLRTINEQDEDGYTLLHYTVKPDKTETSFVINVPMLTKLLSYKFIDIKATDYEGKTILHWAVASGNLEAVKFILASAQSRLLPQDYTDFVSMKTKIDQDGSGGCSAIYWAISPISLPTDKLKCSLEIFKLLLDISEINGTDNQGYTLGHWSVVQGRNDIFRLLIKDGADFSIQDKKGRTVFHLAIETIKDTMDSNLHLANHLIDQKDSILDQLVSLPQYRQEWDKKDHNGYSPLKLLSDELDLTLEDIKDWKQDKNKQIQTNKRPHIDSTEVENCLRSNKKKRSS
ncbi:MULTISPECIES: ankyrin repeat domain-containing protein [unclassified Candidatus Cardinium]|uniref:ankyrin repeat domain-containing protein n=1 Tax=unclassified Candidatus Cardinium TaxID=2641185 RepID=UPI001FB3D6D1|nr:MULTISPECIES: ankyrin repeat domain-containing protein [unclassified Candidatus Cardinium]